MSMPYPGSSPYPTMPPPPPRKRPRAWWFAIGGVLILVSVIVFAISIARFLHTVAHTDAQFPGSGTHQVTLPAHVERGVYGVVGYPHPSCSATDGSGSPIRFRPTEGRFTYDDWVALVTFDTGDGQVTFTCSDRRGGIGTDLRIAAVPHGSDFARLGLLGVGVPLVVGGIGFVVLLVTTILWVSRRPTARPPAATQGWQPPVGPPGQPPTT